MWGVLNCCISVFPWPGATLAHHGKAGGSSQGLAAAWQHRVRLGMRLGFKLLPHSVKFRISSFGFSAQKICLCLSLHLSITALIYAGGHECTAQHTVVTSGMSGCLVT